ncbi:uncharacterized protein [Malus domestica]|uniref:uncharacterized protein n=1 Tax=Malus domestica TaxID=3750 RepID=UPI001460A573
MEGCPLPGWLSAANEAFSPRSVALSPSAFSLKASRSSDREKILSKFLSPLAGCTASFTSVTAATLPVNYLGSLTAPLSILEAMSARTEITGAGGEKKVVDGSRPNSLELQWRCGAAAGAGDDGGGGRKFQQGILAQLLCQRTSLWLRDRSSTLEFGS